MARPSVIRKSPESTGLSAGLSGYSTENLYTELLTRLGEDPQRDGLIKTPERTEKAMSFLTKGYEEDAAKLLRGALFDVDYDEMVIVRDIELFSLCEHHMLPFFGKVHVAYIPNGKVIGLSKIPRLVDVFARRLQVQERLTRQIADCIHEAIEPQGVRRDHGMPPPVHDDARSREAEFLDGDLCHGRRFSATEHARGVPVPGANARAEQLVTCARTPPGLSCRATANPAALPQNWLPHISPRFFRGEM